MGNKILVSNQRIWAVESKMLQILKDSRVESDYLAHIPALLFSSFMSLIKLNSKFNFLS